MLKWNDLPLEIQERMLEEQEAQGNKRGASVFMINVKADNQEDGFDWYQSKEGYYFWDKIIFGENIEHFYTLYPKKESNTQVTDHLNKINNKESMTFEQLQTATVDWANDKNLIKPENAPTQFLKVVEELGELSRSILKEDRKEEIDAFGDVMVTLIILSEQRGLNLVDCLNTAYEVIKNRKGKTVNGTFIKD
jgi:NTP pyrophosphatase (non-canonical NTP hydrolase)